MAAALVTGCVHFDSKPLSPEKTAADFETRKLDDPDLKTFIEKNLRHELTGWPLQTWDFDSLTLAAFYYHPSLDVARAQWGVAQAGEITAGARPNPTVSVGPQYAINPDVGVSPWLALVDFDIPIETAGKRGYRVARARHLSESARLNIASVAWQVRSNLRAALLDFIGASVREKLLRQQIATQEKAIERLQQKLAAGAVASSEITPFRIALQKSRLELADAERLQAEARARAADALGVPLKALAEVDLPGAFPDLTAVAERLTSPVARRLGLHSRADLLAALAAYAASQSALQLEIAKQYPDVHLGPGYEYDQGENKFGLQLSAELPVFNRNQGPIAEAQARRKEAAARFAALQSRVIGDIDHALEVYRVTARQTTVMEGLLAAQRQQEQALEKQLAAGAIERLDLLNAQLELYAGELARHDVMVRRQQALAQLEDALQLPLDFVKAEALEENRDVPH